MKYNNLINYGYFLLVNSVLAIIISCRYLVGHSGYSLDASIIFFGFINHISYILLMSLFIGIIASLGFIFKKDSKKQFFQAIIVSLALIILFIDTEVYLRNDIHLEIRKITIYIMKVAFYLEFKLWMLLSIIATIVLGYGEFLLFKWINKQTWLSNKNFLVNFIGISCISIALTKSIFYMALPNNKQQFINAVNSYIPNFTVNTHSDTNNKNLIQTTIDAIKRSLQLAKIFNLATAEDRFNRIYETHYWGNEKSEFRSGSGAALANNLNLRNMLPELIKKYNIKSILDGACGDFYWMNIILPKLNLDKYIGGDIASYIIKQNKQNYTYPNVEFIQMDITEDKLPNVDLMIVRDALSALSYADIKLFLANFHHSNIKLLLVSTHNKEKIFFNNKDVITGEFRNIDLFDKPFDFDKTKVKLTIIDSQGRGREMILLSKDDVPKVF